MKMIGRSIAYLAAFSVLVSSFAYANDGNDELPVGRTYYYADFDETVPGDGNEQSFGNVALDGTISGSDRITSDFSIVSAPDDSANNVLRLEASFTAGNGNAGIGLRLPFADGDRIDPNSGVIVTRFKMTGENYFLFRGPQYDNRDATRDFTASQSAGMTGAGVNYAQMASNKTYITDTDMRKGWYEIELRFDGIKKTFGGRSRKVGTDEWNEWKTIDATSAYKSSIKDYSYLEFILGLNASMNTYAGKTAVYYFDDISVEQQSVPALESMSIADGAEDVEPDSDITITFDSEIHIDSLTRDNIKVISADGETIVGGYSITRTDDKKSAVVHFESGALRYYTDYVLTVSGITANTQTEGKMDGSASVSFRTAGLYVPVNMNAAKNGDSVKFTCRLKDYAKANDGKNFALVYVLADKATNTVYDIKAEYCLSIYSGNSPFNTVDKEVTLAVPSGVSAADCEVRLLIWDGFVNTSSLFDTQHISVSE